MASVDGRLLMINRPFEPEAVVEPGLLQQQTEATSDLERIAYQVAASHRLGPEPGFGRDFLERLSQQEERLRAAYQHFRQSSEAEVTLSYAAEWLLDNYYVAQ